MSQPIRVQINAFDPSGTSSQADLDPVSRSLKRFALTSAGQPPRTVLAPTAAASLTEWQHPDVGWGVVMSSTRTKVPASLAQLIAKRKAHIFRFTPNWERCYTYLRNETLGRDVAIAGSPRGMGPGRLPHYLLIIGPPTEVPWSVQFALGATRAVGRIPLEGAALDNYIQALLTDFKADAADPYSTVTWAVDVNDTDITELMRTFIAAKVQQQLVNDDEIGAARAVFLDGKTEPEAATIARFSKVVTEQRPGLIVTTSHGLTGPLNDVERMKGTLGLPVDQQQTPLDPAALLKTWSPGGAVWYCHACCSAGADRPSAFAALFDEGAELRRILNAIAETGPSVAPLPMQLLGHSRPVRAFIGHVEPTFDWTLRNPGNGQVLTATLVKAIYPNLYQTQPRTPIGQAFRDVYADIGGYLASWENARASYDAGAQNLTDLLAWQLCARDLQSLVILGDPAAALPLRTGAAAPPAPVSAGQILGT